MKRLIFILLASCGAVYAQQNALLLPWTPQQFTNTNGTVLANGKVCTYQAGTSTGLATYTDSTASVANSVPPNAILLDSTGRPTSGGIWLKVSVSYKITVLTAGSDSTCNTGVVIKTQDQVVAPAGASLTGNNVFTGANSFKNLQNVRYVSPTNLEGWPGANATAWANAAATDLGGAGTVIFRSGTYTIPSTGTGSIILISGVQFTCATYRGCTLNSSGFVAGDFFFFTPNPITDCYVGNFIMVGGGTGFDNRGITNNTAGGANFTRCLFENNKITNVFDGIDAYNTSVDTVVRNNWIQNAGQQGITIQGNTNQVLGNRIDTVGTTNLHHGIYVQEGSGNLMQGNEISNIFGFCIQNFSVNTSGVITSSRIIGNYCKNGGLAASGTKGGLAFAETPPSTGNRQGVIADNTIETTNGNPIYVSATTDAVVQHNTVFTYQGDCITVQGSSSFTTTKVLVDHNVCRSGTVSGNGIRANVNGGTLQNITIDHNIVDTVFGIGIWVQGCTDCNITDNRVKDYNTSGAFSNAGIRLESTTLRNRVSGNIVTTVNVTGTPPALYIVDAASTDNQVFDNYVVTSLNAAVYADAGTRDRVFGNHTQVTNGVVEVATPFSFPAGTLLPAAAGGTDVGSTALPYGNLWLGAAGTNNFKFQPATVGGQRIISIPDPGANSNLTLTPCITSQRTETGADANLLTCAIPAQAGSYRVRFVMDISAANAATLGWTATWTDSNGTAAAPANLPVQALGAATTALTVTTSVAGEIYGYADISVNNSATSIVVKTTFSGTSFTAKASATVERII